MAFVKVSALPAVPRGSVQPLEIEDRRYALCNLDGAIHAIGGVCPHTGGPLGEGILQGANVVCPWHGFEFDCRTGENDLDPGMRVDCFPVRIAGGDILIDPSNPL